MVTFSAPNFPRGKILRNVSFNPFAVFRVISQIVARLLGVSTCQLWVWLSFQLVFPAFHAGPVDSVRLHTASFSHVLQVSVSGVEVVHVSSRLPVVADEARVEVAVVHVDCTSASLVGSYSRVL